MSRLVQYCVLGAFFAVCLPIQSFGQSILGAPPTLDIFGCLPEVDHVDLSPDGNHVAMIATRNNKRYLVDLDLKTEKTVAHPIGDIKVRDIFWVGNKNVALVKSFTSSMNAYSIYKNEIYSVNIQDMKNGKSKLLFDGMSDDNIDPAVFGGVHKIKDGGDYRVSASTWQRKDDGHQLLYSFGVSDNDVTQIDNGPTDIIEWVITPDGKPFARSQYDYDRKVWHLKFREGRDWVDRYSVTMPTDMPLLLGLGRDGESVLIYQENEGYREVSRNGTLGEIITGGIYREAQFHPVTGRYNGMADHNSWVSYAFLDPHMKDLPAMTAKALPGYRSKFIAFAENTHQVLVYGESKDDTGSYYFIDFDTGRYVPVGSTYPDIPEAWITQKQIVHYKAADGLAIEAYLTLPPGREAKNLPLIVLPHGGPEARDDLSFDWDVAAYASRGYAILQPNFRGSAGYGKDFVAKGYNEFGRKMQSDLSDGVLYLETQGLVDKKRVCIVGYSYGGYAALAGVSMSTNVYRCAASYAGITDLPAFVSYISSKTFSDKSFSSEYWKRFLGNESDWRRFSPLHNADRISAPVLLIHGLDDSVVPFSQSAAMRDAIKKNGSPVDLIELKGEDHFLSRAETRQKMLSSIVDFLEKNNPPY